jgi:hypothetical protein
MIAGFQGEYMEDKKGGHSTIYSPLLSNAFYLIYKIETGAHDIEYK